MTLVIVLAIAFGGMAGYATLRAAPGLEGTLGILVLGLLVGLGAQALGMPYLLLPVKSLVLGLFLGRIIGRFVWMREISRRDR